MHELPALDTYLTSLLGTDTVLQHAVAVAWASLQSPPVSVPSVVPYRWLHANKPPQGTPFPYLLITLQTESDTTGVGGVRLLSKPLYYVKAVVDRPSYAVIQPMADRTDDILVVQKGVLQGSVIVQRSVRQQAIRYEEEANNVTYSHLGGLYRFFLSSAPPAGY